MGLGIEVRDLNVAYDSRAGHTVALGGVSFDIAPGEFVSIIGPSGCGKSTLLSVLEGLLEPDGGYASVGGEQVAGPGPERAVVFQQYSLFPWMSAAENVEFAIKQAHPKLKKKERSALAEDFLAKVGLHGISDRYPKELSGGQQQRVAIARALAQDTEVLLMDEPFGAIDAKNRAILQDLLLKLWEGERGEGDPASARKTVVFVTHDLEEAILLSDRIILMEANPGRVRAEFKVPLARPRHRLELLKDPAYVEFRSQLSDIFFENEEAEVAAA
jgi:NitT/TauT family transport system ATP-binding protein